MFLHRAFHASTTTSPLSRVANGMCGVCGKVQSILIRDGTLHKHGSRTDPCAGSYCLPVGSSTSDGARANITAARSLPGSQSLDPTPRSRSAPSPSATVMEDVPFDHPVLSGPLIKHVPKPARAQLGKLLTNILDDIVADPEAIPSWKKLLSVGRNVLSNPKHGGKRHNISSILLKRAAGFNEPADISSQATNQPRTGNYRETPQSQLAAAVSSKIEDGNPKAAIRLICSDHGKPQIQMRRSQLLLRNTPQHPQTEGFVPTANRMCPCKFQRTAFSKRSVHFRRGLPAA